MGDKKPSFSDLQQSAVDVNKLPRGAISMRGMPMGRTARLPSIRTPRDLTLVGTPKRTFVPNIPARRDKKSLPSENASEKTKKGETKNKSSSSPNVKANRSRNKKEYVQLPGAVFGQGIKSMPKANSKVDSDIKIRKPVATRQTRSTSSAPSTSSINVKKEPNEDIETYSSNFEDDDNDYDPDDSDYEPPVCLPLKTDPDLKLKQDKGSKAGWNHEFIKHCCKTASDNNPEDIQDLFFNANGAFEDQLMFFEFPNTILHPLCSREMNDNPQRVPMPGPSTESSSNTQPTTNETVSWAQAVDGYIGKLQLLKSGKTRLVIGDYVLDDLEMFETSPVLQQLISVSGSQSNLDMTVLGQLKHKVRFLADVEGLAKVLVS